MMKRYKKKWFLFLGIGVALLLVAFLAWRMMEREREIRLSHAAEESMEKAYAFKASPEGQKAVAGIGDFAISCGDINVLAQEMLICRIKTLEELRPLSTEDLQFAFNEFTFKALNAMAARERGVVLDWDEVKEKRKIEYESFASKPDRHGGMCGVARARLRHLEDDRLYNIIMITASEPLLSNKELEQVQRMNSTEGQHLLGQLSQKRLKAAAKKHPLLIYDNRFKQPPWVEQLMG
ncbi:MAG: hypothetical protein PHE66_04590 [Syntrophaceticus schinkii]|jgi:hypothetical protein|nr:hypothetical protein [Syntrophaceticus schinkii]